MYLFHNITELQKTVIQFSLHGLKYLTLNMVILYLYHMDVSDFVEIGSLSVHIFLNTEYKRALITMYIKNKNM